MASIRGQMGSLRMLRSGQIINIVNITKFSVNLDSSFMRSMYVGNSIPEGDQSIEGYSGSIDTEVKDSAEEDFIDAVITQNLAGVGVEEVALVLTETYPDGSETTYMYNDCQFKYSREQGGASEKITKRLEFQASRRTKL